MTISPKHCEPCQSCQCTPTVLHTWRGAPVWTQNDLASLPGGPAFLASIDPRRIAGVRYQWRIFWNHEDKKANADFVLAEAFSPYSNGRELDGGPVRDGLLINLPGSNGSSTEIDDYPWDIGGAIELPWRLELGCVRCRCRGGRGIYWPIRRDWATDPVYGSERDPVTGLFPLVGVDQTQYRDADDYGRNLTDDEITRDLWHGGGPTDSQITLTEPRRCPPDEIVWSHRHTLNSSSIGTLPTMSALVQRRDSFIQTALGWMTDGPGYNPYSLTANEGTQYRERFDTVDLSEVNRITLIQPATYEDTGPGIQWQPPSADPSTITQDEIDALVSWLDDGPPRLLTITGCADTLGQINGFLSRFCSLRWEEYAQTNQINPLYPGITLVDDENASPHFFQNPRFVPTGHQFAGTETVYTSRVPRSWDQFYYPGVSGGETLYEIEYELGIGNTLRFPAVAMETRANGSRIVFAPQFWLYSPTNNNANILQPDEVQTLSPYFAANRSATDRLGVLGNHVDALLALYPPTVPRNASVTG